MAGRGPGPTCAPYSFVELSGGGPVLRTRDLSVPDQNGLVVRTLVAGLCRSDVKETAGHRPVRSDFGHEFVGVVDERSTSNALAPGTVVTFDPHVAISRTTAFADYLLAAAPDDKLSEAFPRLPSGVPPERAVFAEPLACAVHACRRLLATLECGRGETASPVQIGIFGAGMAAILQGLFLRASGHQVTLINRSRARLERFEASGLGPEISCHDLSASPEASFDAVLLSTTFSSSDLIIRAAALLRDGGVLLLFGGTAPGQRLADTDVDAVRRREEERRIDLHGRMIVLAGTYGATLQDFAEAITTLREIELEKLIAERLTLPQLPDRLRSAASGQSELVGKVIVSFD